MTEEEMKPLCYVVEYKTRQGRFFTHIVHRLVDAVEIRKKARKDKHEILRCVKMFYSADYTILTVPV